MQWSNDVFTIDNFFFRVRNYCSPKLTEINELNMVISDYTIH